MRLTIIMLVLFSLVIVGCSEDDNPSEPTPTNSKLTLNISGLEDLGASARYEGWIIVPVTQQEGIAEDKAVSTGIFSVNSSGQLSQTEFDVNTSDLSNASAFVLTIEPYPDTDPNPSDVHILGGSFSGSAALVSVDHPAALGNNFSNAAGNYILATPTNGGMTDENSGIWFLNLSSGTPAQGLTLPTLPAGWKYEGWTVINGTPVTTGKFLDPVMADESAPFSGTMPGPPFPGEDFLNNAPAGLTFPTDIAGGVAVISIEPHPDNSPDPFTLKPLVGNIPANAVDHTTYNMTTNLSSFPGGTVSR